MNTGYHEHLTSFVTIARSGSLTRASAATGAGQSTLSRQLLALELRLGWKLYYRSTRRIKLTEMGELFLPHAERAAGGSRSKGVAAGSSGVFPGTPPSGDALTAKASRWFSTPWTVQRWMPLSRQRAVRVMS